MSLGVAIIIFLLICFVIGFERLMREQIKATRALLQAQLRQEEREEDREPVSH